MSDLSKVLYSTANTTYIRIPINVIDTDDKINEVVKTINQLEKILFRKDPPENLVVSVTSYTQKTKYEHINSNSINVLDFTSEFTSVSLTNAQIKKLLTLIRDTLVNPTIYIYKFKIPKTDSKWVITTEFSENVTIEDHVDNIDAEVNELINNLKISEPARKVKWNNVDYIDPEKLSEWAERNSYKRISISPSNESIFRIKFTKSTTYNKIEITYTTGFRSYTEYLEGIFVRSKDYYFLIVPVDIKEVLDLIQEKLCLK